MKKFSLLALDLATLYAALVLTLLVRYGGGRFAVEHSLHIVPFSVIFALWLLAFYITNLYDDHSLRNNPHFYSDLLRASILAGAVSVLFFYLIPLFGITPKTNLLLFMLIFGILEAGTRSVFNGLVEKRFKKSVVIVGLNPQALELAKFIKSNPQYGYRLKYVVDPAPGEPDGDRAEDLPGVAVIKGVEKIQTVIAAEKINTVIVSPEAYRVPELIDVFYKSLDHGITFNNLSSFYERVTGRVPLGAINQVWFLENITEGSKNFYELLKRGADMALAVAMGAFTLVLTPFLAAAVKLDSEGQVFYRQKRFGRNGKIFEIVKFRTMRADAEKDTGAVWASTNDPRITRLGSFLRKSRLDELPQLWNILKGDMSFVGPRAERPEFHETLKQEVPFYEERYLVKPGLSGWAQINYPYGSSVNDAAMKLQYDLYYIKNRSLILDVGIILKTINIALRQAGR